MPTFVMHTQTRTLVVSWQRYSLFISSPPQHPQHPHSVNTKALLVQKHSDTASRCWCVGSPGRSQDTLSPGKDTETWLSFSITQPVLLELRGLTAHHRPSAYAWICIKQRHGSAHNCATIEMAMRGTAAPLSMAGVVVGAQHKHGAVA